MSTFANAVSAEGVTTMSVDLSETDTVRALYEDILRRDADAAGLDAWISALQSGTSVAEARNALIESAEAAAVIDPLVRIYEAAFGRVPDEAGLSGWAAEFRAGKSFLEIAEGFAGSQEFANRYPEAGNGDLSGFITALYRNTLGREPEEAGLNGWLNSGKSVAEILVGFSESQEFHHRSDAQVSLYLSALAQDNTPDASFSMFQLGSSADLSGAAIDGKIAGALVGIDVNGNGTIDAGEPVTSTNAAGDFTFKDGTPTGNLILTGGTDISTGLAFTGRMEAPAGSKVITPLTTLIKKIADLDTDAAKTDEQKFVDAQAALKAALGITHIEADLTQVDYVVESSEQDFAGVDGLSDAQGAVIYGKGAEVMTLVAQGSAIILGADRAPVDTTSQDAADAVFAALAGRIAGLSGGEVLDLASTTVSNSGDALVSILKDAAGRVLSGADLVRAETVADSGARIVAAANREIEDVLDGLNVIDPLSPNFGENPAGSLLHIVRTQKLIQGEVSEDLQAAAGSANPDQGANNLANAVSNSDGSGIGNDALISGQNVGDIDGDGVEDDTQAGTQNASDDLINVDSGAGGGTTPPAPNRVPVFEDHTAGTLREVIDGDVLLVDVMELDLASLASDPDGDALSFEVVGGSYEGQVTLDGAALTYVPTVAYKSDVEETLVITATDERGGETTATISFTVQGADNEGVVTSNTGSVTEDDRDAQTTGGTLQIEDLDAPDKSWIAGTFEGTYGDLTLGTDGVWTYALASGDDPRAKAINALGEGVIGSELFAVFTQGEAQHSISVTVNGTNDAPEVDTYDQDPVDEGGSISLTTEMLSIVDVDTTADKITIDLVSSDGGTITVASSSGGEATVFDLANGDLAVFTLEDVAADRVSYQHNGAEVHEVSFDVTVMDGEFSIDTDLDIQVDPVNDAPVITVDTSAIEYRPDGLDFDSIFSAGAVSISDADNSDDLFDVSLSVAGNNPWFTLDSVEGLSFEDGEKWRYVTEVEFSGEINAIEDALSQLVVEAWKGVDCTLTISVSDMDGAGHSVPILLYQAPEEI